MKVLVINPIMYTSEAKNIKRATSIKDTMMYDFCLAFHEMGHSVTLVGGEPFKPTKSETYPFGVLWWKCKCQKVCMPHCLPFMPETYRYVKQHRAEYDLIITSEVFSLNSLMTYRAAPDKTIIWHELAKHTMPIFLMHTLFAAPLRSVLLKIDVMNATIHVVLGLTISFVGPIIAAWVMKKTKWLEFFLYPNKFIRKVS